MKYYGYDLDPRIICYNSSLRHKVNIINIIIEVARFVSISSPQSASELPKLLESDKIRLVLYIDEMRRILIEETNKIHSFHFPFIVKVENNKFILSFNDYQITNAECSILSAVFSGLAEYASLEEILEQYWEVSADLNVPSTENELYYQLITYLLSFEAGYLRFDHDEDERRVDKVLHPVNHIDFNYTNGATFKFGLSQSIFHKQLIDVINSKTPCYYLSIPQFR